MSLAKANARLALMIAIGELQKQAGPDQRITARSDIREKNGKKIANPRLTGVWKSWEIDANSPPSPSEFEQTAKDRKFLGWLVSSSNPDDAKQMDYVEKTPKNPVTLWDEGTLGSSSNLSNIVKADKVSIADSKSPGAYAWAILDEGVKARINTPYVKNRETIGERTAQLGAGVSPNAEFITGLDSLKKSKYDQDSEEFHKLGLGVSPQTFQLAAVSIAGFEISKTLKGLTHDITPWSVGLFTDTARGGLKQDFDLLANNSALPSEYAGKGVYESVLEMKRFSKSSDPLWNPLFEYASLYRKRLTKNSDGTPLLVASMPAGWPSVGQPATGGELDANLKASPVIINSEPPNGLILMPVIDKVQMLFSLVGRDYYSYPEGKFSDLNNLHGPQDTEFRGSEFHFGLDLLYTPIVTLRNPYNVALQFTSVKIAFVHVPFSARIKRNDIYQTDINKTIKGQWPGMAPLDMMHIDAANGNISQEFSMTLKTKDGSPTFTLLPGETKLFSPYIDPSRTWMQEHREKATFWEPHTTGKNAKTRNLDAKPGYRPGIGFDLDWWGAGIVQLSNAPSSKVSGRWGGCIALRNTDKIQVEFAPRSVQMSDNKFDIRMYATTSEGEGVVSAIQIDYQNPSGLEDSLLPSMRRVDPSAKFPLTFPKNTSARVNALSLLDHSSIPISSLKGATPFALLSVQSKTTLGGQGDREDGRWATKPFAFFHASAGASSAKLGEAHASTLGYEFDFQALPQGNNTIIPSQIPLGQYERSNSTSGHTSANGVKFSVQNDVPLAPIQNLITLNGANPGGSSGYGIRFAQPIGNSWAHPLLAPNQIRSGTALDHSFLLNLALFDRFYFSGLANQTGAFSGNRTTSTLAANFARSDSAGLDDPRLIFRTPSGHTSKEFSDIISKDNSYKSVAAWQLFKGAFNINSTSVDAWKAMLTSICAENYVINNVHLSGTTSSLDGISGDKDAKKTKISRFRLPASPMVSSASAGDEIKTFYWLGAREYSEKEIGTLAENIVKQIRERGPFLSMADFVNRPLGDDAKAQRGALQQAIDDSDINSKIAMDSSAGYDIPKSEIADYGYVNPEAGTGPSYQGAPGYLSQADLLGVLGNAATPRSDTFTIRAYGESRDTSGKLIARAICEAVVQRYPEWVDSADEVETAQKDLKSLVNKTFGRRMQIISFRWLNPSEI